MKATLFYDPEDTRNRIVFEPTLTTGVGWSTGLWLGYRGYGFGFQKSISDNSDYDLELSVGSSSYGLDFRLRHYDASKMDMHFVANLPDEDNNSYHFVENVEKVELESPISYRTLIIEGYYIFNGKHYSNSAVFDQSVQQVKSAGSLVAGATWFSSTVNYANLKSATIIDFMNNVGKTKQWQFSIGAGYAYNWVPQRDWLFNIQAMPMLTLLNHIRTWEYTIDFEEKENSEESGYYYPI